MKAFKYRIEANQATIERLQWVLDRARGLYNAVLTERRAAYEAHVKRHPGYYDDETRQQLTRELTVDYYGQKRDLVDIKELRPEYQEIASHVLQDVILRVKRTFDRLFEQVKNGENLGYPGSRVAISITRLRIPIMQAGSSHRVLARAKPCSLSVTLAKSG